MLQLPMYTTITIFSDQKMNERALTSNAKKRPISLLTGVWILECIFSNYTYIPTFTVESNFIITLHWIFHIGQNLMYSE